ncbi:MAG: cobalt-precorrin-6A reductase [Pseudomonadota bacterium]
MAEKILILGGTKEAASLAALLVAEHGDAAIITSLAGRTREPKPVQGEVRIGGFGGIDGLARYLKHEKITRVIDATHPFATRISANAIAACQKAGVTLEAKTRPPWTRQAGDVWIEVAELEEAKQALPEGARVLLAIGAQHLAVFRDCRHATLFVRTVDGAPDGDWASVHEWIVGRPSADPGAEADLLRQYRITHIVCRNSGGLGAYAKIEAARQLKIPVIIIQRPDCSPSVINQSP